MKNVVTCYRPPDLENGITGGPQASGAVPIVLSEFQQSTSSWLYFLEPAIRISSWYAQIMGTWFFTIVSKTHLKWVNVENIPNSIRLYLNNQLSLLMLVTRCPMPPDRKCYVPKVAFLTLTRAWRERFWVICIWVALVWSRLQGLFY